MESQKKTLENGEEHKRKRQPRKLGGLRTMPFILANEVCDRFSTVGFHANMITYLTQQLNLPLVPASNILTNFAGTASLTSLAGALIADSFAGRFRTILGGSLFYELGLLSITLSALLPPLRPPPCPTQENCKEASASQMGLLYVSLLLTSIGTGGIRPCVVTFAADQLEMTRTKVRSRSWNFFNWYYFCMGIATLTALTVVVYIQDNVGWGWGLGIPTAAMAVSILTFLAGSGLYKKLKPGGSPLVRMAQVIAAAARKRREAPPSVLYENRVLDADINTTGRLLRTDQFRWFDKAAMVKDGEATDPPDLWRLATVHRVEELKSMVRILPIWASGILLVTASSHQGSFVIQQARSMDRRLTSSFQIAPANLAVFTVLTTLLCLVLYERLFVPLARRVTKNPAGITCLQRMGIGLAVNILATVVAAVVERKRKAAAARHGFLDRPRAVIPITVFWLVPQFCLHGVAEVFMSVGHLEFLYDQSPESMRSSAAALYWIATSAGNYLGTALVTVVHKHTKWLPNKNLNRGGLEWYLLVVTGIQVVNLIYYVVCARVYVYKPLEEVAENGEEGEEELTKLPNKPSNV